VSVATVGEERTPPHAARVSAVLWRRPWLRAALTLSPALTWFLVIYLASLVVMLITAFWSVDPFTNRLQHTFTLDNFHQVFTPTYRRIIVRTVTLAALVTITDAVLAVPFAYFMARVASRRVRNVLFMAVLVPLWASYLARIYAWIVILTKGGTLNWAFRHVGLPEPNIGYTSTAMWLVFSYIWLPFMIIPVFTALERIPDSIIEASSDLGAHNPRTLRGIVLPLALPGVIAGSIFTFSLTLGDYITPTLVGGAGSTFIGNVVYNTGLGSAGDLPFAAAFASVPLIVMAIYLTLARRAGAFEAL
jgi:putative spermidine/putrescine transport system permease protein